MDVELCSGAVSLDGVDLNLLRVLAALLEERSVTRAAARVRLSQSATSAALGRLRLLFDDPLLVRTRHGMRPTPRALGLAAPLARALDGVRALLDAPRFDPAHAAHEVRVATGDYGQYVLLPPLVRAVAREAPRVTVTARPLVKGALEHLEAGDADLVVAPFLRGLGSLRAMPLFEDGMATLVRRGHPLARGRPSLERFARCGHVLVSPEGAGPVMVDRALAARGLARFVAVRVPHFLVAPELVASSELVATLPARVAALAAERLPLRLLNPPLELPTFLMAAGWHARDDADPAHRWLRRLLEEVAAGLRGATPPRRQWHKGRGRGAADELPM